MLTSPPLIFKCQDVQKREYGFTTKPGFNIHVCFCHIVKERHYIHVCFCHIVKEGHYIHVCFCHIVKEGNALQINCEYLFEKS